MAIYVRDKQGELNPLNIKAIKGKDGVTPKITVGEVVTLPAGEKATVEIVGEKENPVINFSIPKGRDGDGVGCEIDDDLMEKIDKIDYVDNRLHAITTIREDVNYLSNSRVIYGNEYEIICHKYSFTNLCYLAFIFDVSKFNGGTVESRLQWAIDINVPHYGVGVQLNTISTPPPRPTVQSYLQHTGAVADKKNDHSQQIGIDTDMIMLQFGVRREDGLSGDMPLRFSFNYYINGEELEPIFAGPYFDSNDATVNNMKFGIKTIPDMTTTNNKETEILFAVKNINMEGSNVNLIVDGNIIQKTFIPSGEGYIVSHIFNNIKNHICYIEVVENGGKVYKSNKFTVISKDPNDISPSSVWVNPNKILINDKTLTGKIEEIEHLIFALSSNLYGKKICFIGDSICEQGTFIDPLVSKTGCSIQNLGLSGSGWFARSPQNYITRIDQIEGIPDILVFYGSTNDISINNLGHIGDTDMTTYYGVIRSTLEKAILKYRHNTKYCIITPIPTYYRGVKVRESFVDGYGGGSDNAQLSLEKMSKALKETAEYFSIPCLDLYHCSNFFPIFPDGEVTGDGIHLSSQVAPITTIQKFLESII